MLQLTTVSARPFGRLVGGVFSIIVGLLLSSVHAGHNCERKTCNADTCVLPDKVFKSMSRDMWDNFVLPYAAPLQSACNQTFHAYFENVPLLNDLPTDILLDFANMLNFESTESSKNRRSPSRELQSWSCTQLTQTFRNHGTAGRDFCTIDCSGQEASELMKSWGVILSCAAIHTRITVN